MAFRAPAAFRLTALPTPRLHQRRCAQVQDIRFLTTHDDPEARILAKYKDKLERAAKQKGLNHISQLKEQYKDKIQQLRFQAIVPGATGPLAPPPPAAPSPSSSSSSSSPSSSSSSSSPPPPGIKTLASYLDIPKILPLPQKDILTLWHLRHASTPQTIHFSLPTSTFRLLLQTAKKHPTFVLPLPRGLSENSRGGGEGGEKEEEKVAAELHYLQFAHPHVHTTTLLFTSLAEFKLRGEFASPHTAVTFHAELAESHGVVLGQGSVMENRGVSVEEARWLVMCMQKFYVQGNEGVGRGELLDMFTRGDQGFRVERLIDEAEKIL